MCDCNGIFTTNFVQVICKCPVSITSTRGPARGGRTSSGRRSSWPNSGEILSWCQLPSLSLANPLPLGGPVCAAITTTFIMQAEEMVEMKDLHHRQDHLIQQTDQAEKKEWEKINNWVRDWFD